MGLSAVHPGLVPAEAEPTENVQDEPTTGLLTPFEGSPLSPQERCSFPQGSLHNYSISNSASFLQPRRNVNFLFIGRIDTFHIGTRTALAWGIYSWVRGLPKASAYPHYI